MNDEQMRPGKESIWGTIQESTKIADGIWRIETPEHGGYVLDEERNARIPMELKIRTWNEQGLRGCYEEDVDAALVEYTFPEHFKHTDELKEWIAESVGESVADVKQIEYEEAKQSVLKELIQRDRSRDPERT